MKLLQISTYDIQGGAARAAYRLHRGLRQIGQDSCMVVRYKASADASVLSAIADQGAEPSLETLVLETAIQGHYIDTHRTDLTDTIFSFAYPGYDLTTLPAVQAADIINLHWVARYQSPLTLGKLLDLGKPVVWTLHDQWAFTGGCHYTAGCDKYRRDCAGCPQLADNSFDLASAILHDKLDYLKNANLTIVTPSRWLAACARESRLFENLRVEVIPYSLETDVFRPMSKPEAKAKLGLPLDNVTLLFGATDGREKRKGFHLLLAAIRHCLADVEFQQLAASQRLTVICLGHPSQELESIPVSVVSLGYRGTDEEVRQAFAAADMFILPSQEDNLPNTMLESMSCGTPVVAFNVGGIPDVIKDGVTGYLVPAGDARQLAETIRSLALEPQRLADMGQTCRQIMEQEYALPIQARRYMALYQDLCSKAQPSQASTSDAVQLESPTQQSATTGVLEPGLGPHFGKIANSVLLGALKEYAPYVQAKWQVCEADRAARLAVIEDQGRRLGGLEAERNALLHDLADLRRRFTDSEADRAARLEVIQRQGAEIDVLHHQLQDLQSQWPVKALRRLKLVKVKSA